MDGAEGANRREMRSRRYVEMREKEAGKKSEPYIKILCISKGSTEIGKDLTGDVG